MDLDTLIQEIVAHFTYNKVYIERGQKVPVLLSYSCRTIIGQCVKNLAEVFNLIQQMPATHVIFEEDVYENWLEALKQGMADSLYNYISLANSLVRVENDKRLELT